MTRKELDLVATHLPVHRQVTLELVEVRDEMRNLIRLAARDVADVATAAASIFYHLTTYHRPRHVPRHRAIR